MAKRMARQKEYADGRVHGKEKIYIDPRTEYNPVGEDWHEKIIYDGPNEPMVPYSAVEGLFVENEQLRETLYANQNSQQARALTYIYQSFGQSTKWVNNRVDGIEHKLHGALNKQEIYRIVYSLIVNRFEVNLKYAKGGESKIQYLWRLGLLPMVCITVFLFDALATRLYQLAPQEWNNLCVALKQRQKPKGKKSSSKSVKF